jgi:delta14-sterol reductase
MSSGYFFGGFSPQKKFTAQSSFTTIAHFSIGSMVSCILNISSIFTPGLILVVAFSASVVTLSICAAGTYLYGAEFPVWTYITNNYVQLLTANILISYALSAFLYANSFTVDTGYPNRDLRQLAAGGTTGNFVYDFYIGRELNPRIILPFFGQVDIKTWCEVCPGLTGWILLDLAFVAQQYRNYGYISDSIVFTTAVQAYYVLSSQYNEPAILTMMDITTDGMGFMLSFGDLVWVPFLYSTQARYLAAFPVHLGWPKILAIGAVFVLGIYIFKAANNQKHLFRTQPDHPTVRGLSSIKTKRGTRLLTAGWWGLSRHINYFGDWLQALSAHRACGIRDSSGGGCIGLSRSLQVRCSHYARWASSDPRTSSRLGDDLHVLLCGVLWDPAHPSRTPG